MLEDERRQADPGALAMSVLVLSGLAAVAAGALLVVLSSLVDRDLDVARAASASLLFGAAVGAGRLLALVVLPALWRLALRWIDPAEPTS